MEDVLHIRINGEPRGKQRPKFTKQGRTYTPKETRQYEQEIREAALKAAAIQQYLKPPETAPYQCISPPASPCRSRIATKNRKQRKTGGFIRPKNPMRTIS